MAAASSAPIVASPDPVVSERDVETVRHEAVEHGRALARRHGDDLLDAPLGYAEVVSATVNRRLHLLSAARTNRLATACPAREQAVAARDAAATQLEDSLAAARDAGIDHPMAPVLRRRVACHIALQVHALVGAAVGIAVVAYWIGVPARVAAAAGALGGAAIAVHVGAPMALIRTSLALARVDRAAGNLLQAGAALSDADAVCRAIRAESAAQAEAERCLADELVAVHLEAATMAMPPGALHDGRRLDPGRIVLELPAWIGLDR